MSPKKSTLPSRALDLLDSKDRVLILGASGWFGRNTLSLLTNSNIPILGMGSQDQVILVGDSTYEVNRLSFKDIQEFRPTVVVDAAFLTRNKLDQSGIREFIFQNMKLIELASEVRRMPSVRKFVGVSSGAAVRYRVSPDLDLTSDPYGYLKAEYENQLLANDVYQKKTTLIRPWSVSGPYGNDRNYAIHDFILQARSGRITISSATKVFRKYCAIDELIFMGLAAEPSISEIDSGGEIVELEQLAQKVFSALELDGTVVVNENRIGEERYYAENSNFEQLAEKLEIRPLTLEEQIVRSLDFAL